MDSSAQTKQDAETDRRLQAIRDRYSDRFTNEAFDQIRIRIARSVAAGERLHECDLPNDVGPHFDPRAMTRA